jgi:hypothetical protein
MKVTVPADDYAQSSDQLVSYIQVLSPAGRTGIERNVVDRPDFADSIRCLGHSPSLCDCPMHSEVAFQLFSGIGKDLDEKSLAQSQRGGETTKVLMLSGLVNRKRARHVSSIHRWSQRYRSRTRNGSPTCHGPVQAISTSTGTVSDYSWVSRTPDGPGSRHISVSRSMRVHPCSISPTGICGSWRIVNPIESDRFGAREFILGRKLRMDVYRRL